MGYRFIAVGLVRGFYIFIIYNLIDVGVCDGLCFSGDGYCYGVLNYFYDYLDVVFYVNLLWVFYLFYYLY